MLRLAPSHIGPTWRRVMLRSASGMWSKPRASSPNTALPCAITGSATSSVTRRARHGVARVDPVGGQRPRDGRGDGIKAVQRLGRGGEALMRLLGQEGGA